MVTISIEAGVALQEYAEEQLRDTIEPWSTVIQEARFLTEEQKRDIFYNNAARFLRLSKEEIARHHGM